MPLFVKICGITRREDATAAAGANAVGFVAWPHSPRHVTPAQAARIIAALPPGMRRVGVFVDPVAAELEDWLDAGIDTVQLHGGESADFAQKLAGRVEVWKALRPKTMADLAPFRGYPAARFLIDAASPGRPGGTGKTANWDLARQAAGLLAAPILLAGGLDLENLAAAVAAVHPWGVDVSTGVEDAPGRKNHEKIRAFIRAAQTA